MRFITVISILLIALSVNAQGIIGAGTGESHTQELNFSWFVGSVLEVGAFYTDDYVFVQSVVSLGQLDDSDVTSINENMKSDFQLNMYPNPASEFVRFNLGKNTNSFRISLFNSLGQELLSTTVRGNSSSLDVNQYDRGLYIILLEADNKHYSSRLILE